MHQVRIKIVIDDYSLAILPNYIIAQKADECVPA